MASLPASAPSETGPVVGYSPAEIVNRHFETWPGLTVETVELRRRTSFEYRFRAPCHLLIAAELGEREEGETLLEGQPCSSLRSFTRKLTFVPAGHEFRGSQKPRALARAIYVYIDPKGPLTDPALRFSEIEFKPRLFFHDRNLWETALKLKAQVESRNLMHRQYGEALGVLLAHDLVRFNGNVDPLSAPTDRGGLAGWQQRRLAEYIEAHVSDDIPLVDLARLVQLSPYHFCRSFKRSFGQPPRKYHATRRIERAKQLLAMRELPITTIALAVGFSETSTFSAAFHRLTGQAPSRYRRELD